MQQPYEPLGAQAGSRTTRGLVGEDDPTVSEVVAGYLDRAGCLVDRADDGPTALVRTDAHRAERRKRSGRGCVVSETGAACA